MGNDSSSEINRIGTIMVKMLDGVVRTLTNTKHVPRGSRI